MAKINYATFTPAEVEGITSISRNTQRDWRRRGFFEGEDDGRHNRFSLAEVARLAALRFIIDAGVPIREALVAAAGAMNLVEHHALATDAKAHKRPDLGRARRFVVVAPALGSVQCDSLDEAHLFMAKKGTAPAAFLVVDCEVIGREIQRRANKPLWTIE